MKREFDNILEYYRQKELLNEIYLYNLQQFVNYYISITDETCEKLLRVKEKYNFNTLQKIKNELHLEQLKDYKEELHLEFWRGSGNYDVCLCLADFTGYYDFDKEFGTIIQECDYKSFKINEEETREDNIKYCRILNNIFYSWFSFIWQKINGYENQIVVRILENNKSSRFSLNDFAWYELSKYNDFEQNFSPRTKFFKRNLDLYELFSRADLERSFKDIPPENTRFFFKEAKQINLLLHQNKILLSESESFLNEKILYTANVDSYKETVAIQIAYVNIMNDLLNDDWGDITFNISVQKTK